MFEPLTILPSKLHSSLFLTLHSRTGIPRVRHTGAVGESYSGTSHPVKIERSRGTGMYDLRQFLSRLEEEKELIRIRKKLTGNGKFRP